MLLAFFYYLGGRASVEAVRIRIEYLQNVYVYLEEIIEAWHDFNSLAVEAAILKNLRILVGSVEGDPESRNNWYRSGSFKIVGTRIWSLSSELIAVLFRKLFRRELTKALVRCFTISTWLFYFHSWRNGKIVDLSICTPVRHLKVIIVEEDSLYMESMETIVHERQLSLGPLYPFSTLASIIAKRVCKVF